MSKFYITTSIMYANGLPHVGFALELIQADVLARYHRLRGDDTFLLTGTDEHGTTVARAAERSHKAPQELVDEVSGRVRELATKLNISNDDFIRTSDKARHWPAAEMIWKKLADNGDLYKKEYSGLYCVGHESFVKKSDLVEGICPLHKTKPEEIKEENWFFKLTKYKNDIKKLIENDELKIVPEIRKNEILNLLDDAEDISFSRPAGQLKWGIPVPGDDSQTMYVWTDALTNYISALGYAAGDAKFRKFWPADVHLVGKDIVRFHAIYWPAMLLSAGLPLPSSLYVHGFITVDGEKMSKTIGNVIDPFHIVEKYGTDVTRYFLLREIPSGEDGDFSYKKLEERYNGDLANGLGNLVQRVVALIDSKLTGELIFKKELVEKEVEEMTKEMFKKYIANLDKFLLHEAMGNVWELISYADKYMDEKAPWSAIKHSEEKFLAIMTNLVYIIYNISWMLMPFLPETSFNIFNKLGADTNAETLDNYKFRVQKTAGLFPRFEK